MRSSRLSDKGESGGAIIPDLEISGGRPVSKKFFWAFLNFRVFIVRDTKIGMRPR